MGKETPVSPSVQQYITARRASALLRRLRLDRPPGLPIYKYYYLLDPKYCVSRLLLFNRSSNTSIMPSAPQSTPPPLPEGWVQEWDEDNQRAYFVETRTGAVQWRYPGDLGQSEKEREREREMDSESEKYNFHREFGCRLTTCSFLLSLSSATNVPRRVPRV